jgi:hypothetical protein
MKIYLESTRSGTTKRFEVLNYNAETKKGVVLGEMGTEFETAMDKETLVKYGYKVIKGE